MTFPLQESDTIRSSQMDQIPILILSAFCLSNTDEAHAFLLVEKPHICYMFISKFKNGQKKFQNRRVLQNIELKYVYKILHWNSSQPLINVYSLTAKLPNSYHSATQYCWVIKKISIFNKRYGILWFGHENNQVFTCPRWVLEGASQILTPPLLPLGKYELRVRNTKDSNVTWILNLFALLLHKLKSVYWSLFDNLNECLSRSCPSVWCQIRYNLNQSCL